jgi:hypothetical protein
VACTRQPELREDAAPLTRRVQLPQPPRTVRWIATPAYIDSRWLEAPEKPMHVAAWLQTAVDPAASAAVQFDVAAATAERVLPKSIRDGALVSDDVMRLSGTNAVPGVHSIDPLTFVERAVWLPGGLWLELLVRDE